MSFEVFSIGTSGMMPLPGRFLTSSLVRRDGDLFLFDAGEGTQVSLKMLNLKWKKIDSIFISHMHADHVTGLPGILMLSSQVDRDEPLYIYGPEKLRDYVEQNRKILDMYINYEIIVIPVEEGLVMERDEFCVYALSLRHTKPCFGYTLVEKNRKGEFYPDKAEALGIPKGPLWGRLQSGGTVVTDDGRVVKGLDVMGPERKGRKYSYITDTLYFPQISEFVKDSDILFCEAMFDESLKDDAHEKKHMTAKEAATIAKDANVGKLCLQHYSPRYSKDELRLLYEEASSVFSDTVLTRDRMSFDIPFKA